MACLPLLLLSLLLLSSRGDRRDDDVVPSLVTILSRRGVAPPPTPSLAGECTTLALRLSVLASANSERPRFIHDVRVALRRLLTLVDAFQEPLRSPRALLRELKALRRATNRARDVELLHASLPAFPFRGALLPPRRLRDIRAAADGFLVHCLGLEKAGGGERTPLSVGALARPLRALAAAAATTAAAASAACGGRARGGSTTKSKQCFPALHHARTKSKQLRYALRALGRGSGPAYEALSAAQDDLGKVVDAEVVRAGLQGLARKRPGGVALKKIKAAMEVAEAARESARGAAREALAALERVALQVKGAPQVDGAAANELPE